MDNPYRMMVELFKKFSNSAFARNLAVLLSGNALAQAISLISIPLLTRLYTPGEFGSVALFIALVHLFGMAATGGYDTAIMIPKRNGEAFSLLAGSIGLAALVSTLCLLVIIILRETFYNLFEADSYRIIIWLIPLLVFFQGSYNALYTWLNRGKEFKTMGLNRVMQNSAQVGTRLNRWAFPDGHWGLAVGYMAGLFSAWVQLTSRVARKEGWRLKFISTSSVLKILNKHAGFPKFLLPMTVLNSFSLHLLVYVLSIITTSYWVGIYERAWRVMSFPKSLLATTFMNVFFQKLNTSNNRKRLYLLSYLGNLALVSVILAPVAFWAEEIFTFVLGEDWAIAGTIARLLLPLTILNYATSCVNTVFSVEGKNHILLTWQVSYLLVTIGWIIIAKGYEITKLIMVFSWIGGVMYLLLAIIGYLVIKRPNPPKPALEV